MGVDKVHDFEAVIGLEIHVELSTDSKIFCSCPTAFGAEVNTQCCPICLGLPGTLPAINRKALEYTVKAGLALNCQIARHTWFDRKNYFYPDLPKAYQVSQQDAPLCFDGYLEVPVGEGAKRVGINRVHLEEEVGKSLHAGETIIDAAYSLLDYNRAGIPLIEIVTEPDIRSAEEAQVFLERLRNILRYIDISDCKMQEGSLRCDANISLRPKGSTEFGTKTEIKNLNSFRAVRRALEYEINRQAGLLRDGRPVEPETRHWDEQKGVTIAMRSKRQASYYRCFADPDLVPIDLSDEWIGQIEGELPELPGARRRRFIDEYGLPEYDAQVLTSSKEMADFFEEVVQGYNDPKAVSNWIMTEILRYVNEQGEEAEGIPLTATGLVELLQLIEGGVINRNQAKEIVLPEMVAAGKSPRQIVKEKGLEQISDTSQLEGIVASVLEANPDVVQDYLGGKDKVMGFLVGQVLKATKGKANPRLVNEMIREKLKR
jgi:aspartyl-tRNA(Asn)/glutamyl-tRNA(Gln) amidotransferase subunit B